MNPNIALSYKPVELDIEGAMQFRENKKRLESQNALAAAEQANQQDKLRNALALRDYAAKADFNDPKQAMSLMRYGESGANMLQSLQAGQASSASARKTGGEYANQKADYYLNGVLPFARNSGKQGIISMLDMMRKDPDLAGSPLVSMPKEFADTNLPDPVTQPDQYAQWEQRMGLGLSEFLKRNTLTANEQSMETDRAAQREISRGQLGVSQGNLEVARDRLAFDQSKLGTGGAELAPKDRQKRDASFPQASAGLRGAVKEIDTLRKDLLDLQSHRGLSGITGAIEGRLPSMSAGSTSAQALLNKILARGQFRELQNMRNNSPTGGALGAISDRENASLRAAFGALDQAQSKEDFQKAINDIISQLDFSKGNITQAFEDTYSYRQGAAPAGAPAAPAAAGPRKTKSGVTYTVED